MTDREDAIKIILDNGGNMTEQDIQDVMDDIKKNNPKPDTNREVIDTLNKINDNLNRLREDVKAQNNKEIRIPDFKIPDIKVPAATFIHPERPRRKTSFSFVRDVNGNIISATAEEE
ncbi:hypothetical protein LCGC14_1013790 [marine sediment metagenome]|uniref:Uncharacterized protein n=1 Tax=marine sediment metagenome TaxID=412755 RepID=A0A0F9NKZ4_9ZZZZ|nr:hypothetical protein [Candidatus Aminicenantes bacterium]